MAKTKDVVKDIYGTILKHELDGEAMVGNIAGEILARKASTGIRKALTKFIEAKDPDYERPEKTLFVSEVGKPCLRQLWYSQRKDTPRETLMPSAKIKFLYGDILEELLIFLCRVAGHEVTEEQGSVEIPLRNGWKIRGRMDFRLDGEIVDAKSASSYAFKKFKSNTVHEDDTFGYMAQLHHYNKGNGVKDGSDTHFLAIDKTTGALCLSTYQYDEAPEEEYLDYMEQMTNALEAETEPARPFPPVPEGKSGNMKLPVACSYCKFKEHCYRDANEGKGLRTFVGSRGPVFLVTVKREPRMKEIKASEK